MASNISTYEYSVQDGEPIECYLFTHEGDSFLYTSHCEAVSVAIKTDTGFQTMYFEADYIKRGEIKPTGRGEAATLDINVAKDNPIAKLWLGPPPERAVKLWVFRLHRPDLSRYDTVFTGRIGQASFEDSECKLTGKMESWLEKELPGMCKQYFCGNLVFDRKCRLKSADYEITAFLDKVEHNIYLYSAAFAQYQDGYFKGGVVKKDADIRMIRDHIGDKITLQYPFITVPRNNIQVLPGCDHLFGTCALRYKNTLNFTGFPYVAPANPSRKDVGKGVYWVDSLVVKRDTDGVVGTISL
ncbi:MAG: phage BR0599 family protein [Sporomusaceae bacterium]|nr:phage BR0599 family protein [Sporomusaceae bacterium]